MGDKMDVIKENTSQPRHPKTVKENVRSPDRCFTKSHVESDAYNFKSGIAVIINNTVFDSKLQLADRTGSNVDASALFHRFQELGFKTDLLYDVTIKDMEKKFDKIKKNKEMLEKTDCLVVALLTHGGEGETIYTTDQEIKIKTIIDQFNATNCPELLLKPKIFILQASRGTTEGTGVDVTVTDPNQADCSADVSQYIFRENVETIRIPNEADFLAVYATSQGYRTHLDSEKGSSFVRILCEELLSINEEGEDFYKVLTRVNRKVGTHFKPNISTVENAPQMPCFVSHLTKKLILKRKPIDIESDVFSVVRLSSKDFKKGEKVPFEKVLSNNGNGYNPNTGIFRASKTGLYQFSTTIMSLTVDTTVSCAIQVNGQTRLKIYGSKQHAVGTVTDVILLSAGDQVYIEMLEDGGVYGNSWSSFSGYFIR